jgi:hypothetical protein
MLNSALNEGSFRLNDLKKQTTDLTDDEQALQRDVDAYAAPDALQRRARELGMVPGGDPAFLNPDGTVRGVPGAAAAPSTLWLPAPPPPQVAGTTPSPAPTLSASPKATPNPTSSQVKPAPSTSGR